MSELILIERQPHYCWLRINRPDRANALSLATMESVVRELARSQAIVIRGRGSHFILKDYPGALHVLVVAPLEVRVMRVMEDLKLDQEAAKQEIARVDNSNRQFVKRYF